MFELCEFCPIAGEGARIKRLPFGEDSGTALVILEAHYKMGDVEKEELLRCFPGAYFVFRRTCANVDVETGNLGCGILIRNILSRYKVVVLPKSMTKEFFGITVSATLVEHKTGQFLIAYSGNVTSIEVQREFERAVKQI